MKNTKKLLSLAMTLVLALALALPAFAAGTGVITVKGVTPGKTYEIYKIFDLTYTGSGEDVQVAYTIDTDWAAFFAADGEGAAYIVDANTDPASLNRIVVEGKTKYINIVERNVAEFAQKALGYAMKKTADASKVAEENATVVEFSDLDLGYYLVYPQGATDIKDGFGSLCSLSATTPNMEVNVKADYPTIDKVVSDPEVEIGQTVTYTITGQVPDTTGYGTYTYKVTDTMSAGLTFNEDVVVKFGTETITPAEGNLTYADNGFALSFDMVNYQDYIKNNITITYTAVVNENAVIGGAGNANEAKLEYSNTPTTTIETTPETVIVYTSSIVIDKFDGDSENGGVKLAGAEFVLYKVENETNLYYQYTAATASDSAKVLWVADAASATKMTTDADGKASFTGIQAGRYFLEETAAPTGFNLLTEPVEVNITNTGETAHASVTATVANYSGAELPSTGGMGTTIFYTLGGLLAVGAVILLVTKKRMHDVEQ